MLFGALSGDDTGDDRESPPIVLLHGLTFDRRTWRPIIDTFRMHDRERRVVALDLPGHGESPPRPPHDLPVVAAIVHDALQTAGVERPVMVGHSISGALVTLYAGSYPVAGVVNVDQPPVIEPFAQLVKSIEPQLRGADFDQVWQRFYSSFNIDLLPQDARVVVESTCNPRQEVVVSYWSVLLDRPLEEVSALIEESMVRVAAAGSPYLLLAGHELPDPVVAWIRDRIPQLDLRTWEGTGHFPHLAHPDHFAEILAATADWRDCGQ